MNKGDSAYNFVILDVVNLEELKAQGIWARHKSGAEVFHVLNEDPENLFGFAFSTAPEDSTGVAHILEHSVLCGSQNYPLKDAFLTLAQGSLQTFLNAWTFPDKTVYPASSINEKDYFNLMSVYADAVFRPLLSQWTFMQEGWRLVPAKNGLEYTGVVYNEMKGAYSSMDTYAGLWSVKAVMPGTPYAFESGGDPDHIPDLSWEQLKEFHHTRYVPANCRIFLAGNIPTEKQLSFLDNCLSGLEPGSAAPSIKKTVRWKKNQLLHILCPGNGEKPQAMVSWLCNDSAETEDTMTLVCLGEILLGHDGSPLTRTLIESGLGEDISPATGLETELQETVFTVGLRGIKGKNVKDACRGMETFILDQLALLANNGIPEEEIDAALLAMEFSHREIKRSQGPYSLVWMRRSLRSWLYGKRPWDTLLFTHNFSRLKQRITENPPAAKKYNDYFESVISRLLLNNHHHALVIIEGETNYLSKKEKELAQRLKEKEQLLNEIEKEQLEKDDAELKKLQSEAETKEVLESIPHLTREDIIPEIEIVPSKLVMLEGRGDSPVRASQTTSSGRTIIPSLIHPLFTNGISYVDLAFPVDILDPEDYPWLPFFARSVVSMGLPGMDYGAVSSLLARTLGGFYALLETGSAASQYDNAAMKHYPEASISEDYLGRDWIIYRLKALDEKLIPALELVYRLITEADFSDLRRLKDLAVEMKNEGDSSLAPLGHNYASGRAGKFFSRPRLVNELWNGLEQLPFAHELAAMDMDKLKDRLFRIRDTLACAGLFINLTASKEAMDKSLKAVEIFSSCGGPRPANPACRKKENFYSLFNNISFDRGEIFSSPSLQIGFAAMSCSAAPYGSPEQAAEIVFSHELSTGALWESIRMMGGAYGAFANPDSLEGVFSFSTYRDPDPLRSLRLFPEILNKRSINGIDEDILEKTIIGAYAKETRPHSPSGKGFLEFLRCLYGVSAGHRLVRLKYIMAMSAEETNAASRRLAQEINGCPPIIIAGKTIAQKAAKKFGVEIKELPV